MLLLLVVVMTGSCFVLEPAPTRDGKAPTGTPAQKNANEEILMERDLRAHTFDSSERYFRKASRARAHGLGGREIKGRRGKKKE